MAQADNQPTDNEKTSKAKRRFFIGLLDMSWRLAGVFLVPVFLGLWLDSGRDSSLFTLIGLAIGVIGSGLVIRKIVSEYSVEVELDD
jgi:F0F1-type ATP synthase assembly protein I